MFGDGHRRTNSESGINESLVGSNGMGGGNRTNQNFLTNTKREKDFWINKIETPYTHPTSMLNPGPGKYDTVPVESPRSHAMAPGFAFQLGPKDSTHQNVLKNQSPGP